MEMRTVEEASNAMALDGIIFEACQSETCSLSFFFSLFIFIRGMVTLVVENEKNECENVIRRICSKQMRRCSYLNCTVY